ncbi:hypothetical protein BGW80DRAFT_1295218 [Lactifluus volemus]|nr:hypothetical protein BGW80DRAFT_1295218 [Lactifluus volemus]
MALSSIQSLTCTRATLLCLAPAFHDDGDYCGLQVNITADNGRSVVVTVAGECPGCDAFKMDLSVAATFEVLEPLPVGRRSHHLEIRVTSDTPTCHSTSSSTWYFLSSVLVLWGRAPFGLSA